MNQGTIFITGAGSGIGMAVARGCLEKGYSVAGTVHDPTPAANEACDQLRETFGHARARFYRCDVRSSASVDQAVEQAADDFGGLYGMVYCAGIAKEATIMATTDEAWEDVLRVNLTGAFYAARAVLPHFLAERRGRVVLVSSLNRNGAAGVVSYAASKAGMTGLAGTIAKEYGAKGITCNLVAPGFVETSMTVGRLTPEIEEFWMNHCPKHRYAKSNEIASAVSFFLGADADFVNGTTLEVTGGLSWRP